MSTEAEFTPRNDDTNDTVSVVRDPKYYLAEDLIIFQVENTLFRINATFLARESEVFGNMFLLPPPADSEVEGITDDKPIYLEGLPIAEFRCLLSFFYDRTHTFFEQTTEEWLSLLSISSRYLFENVRRIAISHLTSSNTLSAVEKIHIAHQYSIASWIPGAVYFLCKREAPLSEDEAMLLGLTTAIKIMTIREVIREKGFVKYITKSHFPYDKVYSYDDSSIMRIIKEFFA